jgi:hypothetical protein
MYVVRCPVCRRANVREPLVEHSIALVQARDRVEGSKTGADRLTAIAAARRALVAADKARDAVREYLLQAEHECGAAVLSPAEVVVPEYRSDPPPPEFMALLAKKRPPASPAADDTPISAAPERRELPSSIAGELAALKAKLAQREPSSTATYGRLRISLWSLQPLLAQIAESAAPAKTWESKLRELVDQEPFDRASARSFVEALAPAASGWHRYDSALAPAIAQIASACREQIELSLGIVPKSTGSAAADAGRPIARGKQR